MQIHPEDQSKKSCTFFSAYQLTVLKLLQLLGALHRRTFTCTTIKVSYRKSSDATSTYTRSSHNAIFGTWKKTHKQHIFLKVDQCQPHENFQTACQSSQVVNWVKTKPRLAGNQIPFRGTYLVFYCVGVYRRYQRHLYTVQIQIGSSGRNSISC